MFVLVATEVLFSSFDLYTDEDVEAQRQFCGQALRLKIIRRKVCPFNRRRRLCYTSSGLASDHSPDRRHRRRTTRVRRRGSSQDPPIAALLPAAHPLLATKIRGNARHRG